MLSRHRFLLSLVCLIGLVGFYAPAMAGDDPMQVAKAQHAQDRAKAKSAFLQAIDAQIKSAGSAGNLDLLKTLTSQKDAFETSGILPDAPSLKDAVTAYNDSMRKADGQLVAAYETAIDAATPEQAMVLRKERRDLLEGSSGNPTPDSPDAVGIILSRAKAQYTQDITAAKGTYLHAFDARIDSATSAGDLSTVEKLQAAKTAADSGSPLPDGFSDSTITSAHTGYQRSVFSANQKLAGAYREAVRNFTRLKAIDRAQATQTEFESTGLANLQASAPSTGGGGSSEGLSKLTHSLPSYLTASGGYSTETEGIKPAGKCVISTKTADLLTKDFLFDLSVHVPREDHEIIAGFGDGTEKGSIRVRIREDGGWGRRASLTHGDEWGETIGDIHKDEIYVIRFERHGGPLTVSVGSITNGKFTADMTQTLSDPKTLVPGLSDKRSKVFFEGEAVFCATRFLVGANAAISDAAGSDTSSHSASAYEPVKFASVDPATPGAASTPGATPAPTADALPGVFRLSSDKLPDGFISTGTFSIRGGGLVPFNDKTLIETKDGGFLSKDFLFAATVQLSDKPKPVVIGIGDGTVKGSLRLCVRIDNGWGLRAFLCRPGDEWGKRMIDLKGDGPRVLQVDRKGNVITMAVGSETDGKFTPEANQSLSNPTKVMKDIGDRHAKLFFTGEEVWTQLKLQTGPANADPQ